MRDFLTTPRWVPWRYIWRNNKFAKAPCTYPGRCISWTNPEEWMTARQAADECKRNRTLFKQRQIGFVFAPNLDGHLSGYAAVDLDGCINPDTGELADWALAVVDQLDSYTELSPSRTGLRIICRASGLHLTKRVIEVDAPSISHKRPQMELFYGTGFVTITLQRFRDQLQVSDRSAELDLLFPPRLTPNGLYLPATPVSIAAAPELTLSDEEVLKKARNARNGAKFTRLFDLGDTSTYDQDLSRADYALLRMLRWWTRADAAQMRRLALNSALRRDKWNQTRGDVDWLDYVIGSAVQEGGEVYLGDGVLDATGLGGLGPEGTEPHL